jgi:type II secretory ATPase GspE/PulE/Tfp pilus assembly ATPase PilB-like protein
LFELLVVDDRCRELIQRQANAAIVRQAAIEAGMELLAVDGMAKVDQGLTTMSEVWRVTNLVESE